MKKFLSITSLALVFAFAACKGNAPADLQGEKYPVASSSGTAYALDTASSVINWKGSKITGSHIGTVKVKSGEFYADGDKITAGKFIIDMPTITDNDLEGEWKAKLEGHLKDTDFFEVGKYPEGLFEIASVTTTDSGYDVRGNLTLKGITKGIQFPASIQFEDKKPVSATGSVKINRQNWNIVYKGMPDDLISDTIELELNLVTK
ncbi:YceI family protein [Leptospira sp. GIMC2001]|uniref:YceI family protein n=1 Tax=Leptospira sp. GIMC2001 TaxID=1513297 RepID=UPI00234AF450|nr:YceI family protein [Leptospira sp. GIMC2001]WCL47553.1 YceI family protein [Leptospira sp. GIMC2001]